VLRAQRTLTARIQSVRLHISPRKWLPAAALLLAAAALFGCSTPETNTALPATPIPSSTRIPDPTPFTTPTPIPQVLLIAGDTVAWEGTLSEWAVDRGWNLEVADPATASARLRESAPWVAVVSAQATLSGDLLQAAAEGIPVLLIDVPGVDSGPSLSIIGNAKYDQAGFLAGVMTGLASQTGWVGEVTATGGPNEADYSAGFAQGLIWSCPICQLVSQTAADMTLDGFQAKSVDVVFAFPGPAATKVAEMLAAGGLPVVWIGAEGPAAEALIGRVIFEADRLIVPALEALLETGEGAAWRYSIESRTTLPVDINADLLTPGRQRLLDQAYEAIAEGNLDIGTEE